MLNVASAEAPISKRFHLFSTIDKQIEFDSSIIYWTKINIFLKIFHNLFLVDVRYHTNVRFSSISWVYELIKLFQSVREYRVIALLLNLDTKISFLFSNQSLK